MSINNKMKKDITNFLKDRRIKFAILECMNFTKQTGKEYGFHFAIDGNNIIRSRIVEGDSNGIAMEEDPDWTEFFEFKKHGTFHTHPSIREIILPSIEDINYALFSESYFTCIGMSINNIPTVKCFPTEIIKMAIIDIKEYLKDIDDLSEITDDTERLVTEFNNAANELRQSMKYASESWEDSIIIKKYKT